MNIHAKLPMTPEEFLVWNEDREGKREFVNGKVVEQMMIHVTRSHYFLASRLLYQLATQLGLEDFIVGSADFGVKFSNGVRYPDVMVEKAGGAGKDLATSEPLLIAEILSPSTMADDFGPKAREYLSLASLRHYIILSQDEARVWVWSRDSGDQWVGPEINTGIDEVVQLNWFGLSLNMQTLYSGIALN
jgi:Uma2 family endonuclease